MTTQPPDLKKLREVAEKATPGPWKSQPAEDGYRAPNEFEAKDHQIVATDLSCVGIVWDYGDRGKACAEFIATFNPQTILALLDAYEASARDAERYRWLRSFRCPSNRYPHITQWPDPSSSVPQVFGGAIPSRENLDKAIDAARHATQGD